MRGKKLTRAQRELLKKYKLDPAEYLYLKQLTQPSDPDVKNLNRSNNKEVYLVFNKIGTEEEIILKDK